MSKTDDVAAFHGATGKCLPALPAIAPHDDAALADSVLLEEVLELSDAITEQDLAQVAKEVVDVVYSAISLALVYGIDFDAVWDAVHASNMTKIGPDGKVAKRADGKVVKGPHYQPPDIAKVLGVKP